MKLDKWDNLLIRACKGRGNTNSRLRKIFRKRCGLSQGHNVDDGLTYHLLKILEGRKQGLTFDKWIYILSEANPNSIRNQICKIDNYDEGLLWVIAGQISVTAVAEWEGYIKPAFFRNGGFEAMDKRRKKELTSV